MPTGTRNNRSRKNREFVLTPDNLLGSTDPKLGLLVRSIFETYRNDPTIPSVVMGWLPGMQMYYVSITRYDNTYGRLPKSVISAKSENLLDALNSVFQQWMAKISPSTNATDTLVSEIGNLFK